LSSKPSRGGNNINLLTSANGGQLPNNSSSNSGSGTNTRYSSNNNATIVPEVPPSSEGTTNFDLMSNLFIPPTEGNLKITEYHANSNNPAKKPQLNQNDKTVLVIRKIPPHLNTIGALNKYFSKFGTVV